MSLRENLLTYGHTYIQGVHVHMYVVYMYVVSQKCCVKGSQATLDFNGVAVLSCWDLAYPKCTQYISLEAGFSVLEPFLITFTFPLIYSVQIHNYESSQNFDGV